MISTLGVEGLKPWNLAQKTFFRIIEKHRETFENQIQNMYLDLVFRPLKFCFMKIIHFKAIQNLCLFFYNMQYKKN